MSRAVWKFPLDGGADIPAGARILSVDIDPSGNPCVWALVDPEAPRARRILMVVGTGWPLPDESHAWTFVGTFVQRDQGLVFHVFEAGEPAPEEDIT